MSESPRGWTDARLGEVTQPQRVGVSPQNHPLLPYIGLEHVEPVTTRILSTADASSLRSTGLLFDSGSTLYARLRPYLNKVCTPEFPGIGSSEFIIFPPGPYLAKGFLKYLLNQPRFVHFTSTLDTGDRPRVNWTGIRDFRIGLPPLVEQERIVAAIEEQFSRLDAGVAALERVRQNLKRMRAAVLHAAAEDALACSGQALVPLSELLTCPLANGRSVRDGPKDGFPVLRLTCVREGRIDTAQTKPGAWNAREASPYKVEVGDFLIVRGNGSKHLVGRGGLVMMPFEVAYPDTLIRARLDSDRILPAFVALLWDSPPVRRQIETQARTTAGIYKINQASLNNLAIPVPALEGQMRILRSAEVQLASLQVAASELSIASARAQRLRSAILQSAFSGKLVRQSGADEPATELLERIAEVRPDGGPTSRMRRAEQALLA